MIDSIDSIDSIPAAAPAAEPKRQRTRGPLNQAHLRKLNKAEDIGKAAGNTDYAAALAGREISADFVAELLSDTDDARTKAADAMQRTTAAKNATAEEGKAATALIAALQEVQKAAKQKYARSNRIALGDYFVGKKLNGSRPNLLQTSQTILKKIAGDTLPGITPVKVKKLGALRKAWIDANATQTENRTAAQSGRADFKAMLKSIEDRRAAIQLAADAEWPHTDKANAAIRKEFGLSSRQSFKA